MNSRTRNLAATTTALVVLATTHSGQNMRAGSPLTLDHSSSQAIHSKDDRTLAVFTTNPGTLNASVSDGRGIEWSAPVDIGGAGSVFPVAYGRSIRVLDDDTMFVTFTDGQSGHADAFFTRSIDGGTAWEAPMRLDDLRPAGDSRTEALQVAVDGDAIYVLQLVFVEPFVAAIRYELVLNRSFDRGANWETPIVVAAEEDDVYYLHPAIAVSGSSVNVLWLETLGSVTGNIQHRRSVDSGATFGAEQPFDSAAPASANVYQMLATSDGSSVAVGWRQQDAGSPSAPISMRVRGSTDGGASFGSEQTVGEYDTSTDSVASIGLAFTGAGLLAHWTDDRTGTHQVHSALSADVGANWSSDVQLSSEGQVSRSIAAGSGDDVALFWNDEPGPTAPRLLSSYSADGGATWSSAAIVEDIGPIFMPHLHDASFNPLYRNYVALWRFTDFGNGGSGLFAGGYRPQTLEAQGFNAGSLQIDFTVSEFVPAPGRFAVIGASFNPGPMPLPDGRITGLVFDSLMMNLLGNDAMKVELEPDGSATTTVRMLVGLPPGATVYTAAVALDTVTGTYYDLTDVVELTTL